MIRSDSLRTRTDATVSPLRVHRHSNARMNSQVRKAARGRGHFPSDEAARKLVWLVLRNISAKWKSPPIYWHAAKAQLALQFQDRFIIST